MKNASFGSQQVKLVLISTRQILLKGVSMMNKILSLAMDMNRTKLLLTSPLIFFVVLTITTTPAQAQYWDRWYYQTYQQRYYSGYSHGYSDGQYNYTYDCSGHTSRYCSGYGKG